MTIYYWNDKKHHYRIRFFIIFAIFKTQSFKNEKTTLFHPISDTSINVLRRAGRPVSRIKIMY